MKIGTSSSRERCDDTGSQGNLKSIVGTGAGLFAVKNSLTYCLNA
jgi:hypothetical protein